MKHQLASIQDDAQHARSKVQDKEDQLSFLKEQVQSYQKKYDESREMLAVKSEAIQNLQTQMDILCARIPERERNGHLPNRDQSPSKKGKREDYGNYSGCNGIVNNNTEPPPGRNYHSQVLHPPPEDSRFIALQERICALESQCATKDTLLSSLECELEVEKLAKENTARAMESKDAEITMQKVTINHLQEALVAVKRGGSVPAAPSVPCGKVFHI
jgi:hypothetical protein